ncbi:PAS domain-containing sensor histidine kinase [Methanocalculus sp.]|uniref:PAS domain-containing protein n=1 Tax=Methanocalculus sp. TaxID=2004547 RepID=UPI00260FEC76|nr:PAS domain-containing sensor histidine kinase [Methanocalculus sp.]MDG6251352.1 PAS domain S-box protein [Methanocalculus sp.]
MKDKEQVLYNRLMTVMAAAGVSWWEIDCRSGSISFSDSSLEMLGYRPEDFADYTDFEKIIHPDDLGVVADATEALLTGRIDRHQIEYRIRLADGDYIWISDTASVAEHDEEGKPLICVGLVADITERKLIKEALRESERKYRLLMENIPDVIYSLDRDGKILYLNEAPATIEDYTPAMAVGKPFLDLIHPADREMVVNDFIRAIEEGREYTKGLEFRCFGRNENITWKELHSHARYDEEGNLVQEDGVLRDITDRKHAEEALRIANHKLKILTGITRHDILNQVMVLQGYLEFAQEICVDAGQSRYLDEVKKAATAIQRDSEFTRAYEMIGVDKPLWLSLRDLAHSVEGSGRSGLPITSECENIEIYADPMLEKVFANLMDNTVRHGEKATGVHLTCTTSDDGIIVAWEDDGAGVPDDLKKKIFSKGFGKNTGFGLFLASEILSITGITIRENGVHGEGARFEMHVPEGGWRNPEDMKC